MDDSGKLFFIPDIFNIIDYLVEDKRVQRTGKYGEYERKLLIDAVEILKEDDNLLTGFIKEIDEESVKKLIQLVGQSIFDVEVQNLLKKLKINLAGSKFMMTNNKMIRDSLKQSSSDTFILTSYLIRHLLSTFSSKYLKRIPEESFARGYFSQFENPLIINNTKDSEVLIEIEKFWIEYIGVAINGSKEFQVSAESTLDSLFGSNNYWLRDRIFLLRILKVNLKSNAKSSAPIDIRQYVHSPSGEQIISECIRIISINLLREFLGESYPGGQKMDDLYRKRYFKTLSSKIINQIYSEEYDKDRSFESTLLDKGISTFLDILSKDLVSRLKESIQCQQNKFELTFKQVVKGHTELNEANIGDLDDFDFSLSFFQFLETMARDLVKKIIIELILIKEQQVLDRTEFLTHQLSSFIKYLSRQGYLSLPLRVTTEDLDKLLNELFSELSHPEKEWEVFFEIGNVDFKGEIITIDKITLFDARKWHKDESFEWDQRSEQNENFKTEYREYGYGFFKRFGSNERVKIPFKRNSARSRVCVSARDSEIAVSKARSSLKKIFSTIVFEFSKGNREKYHPQVSNRFQVMSINGKEGTYDVNFNTSGILKVTPKEKSIIDWYAKSTSVSHRASRLYRGLSWFNAAFWEQELHAKYALYWIGLEQLLDFDAEGNKDGSQKKLLRLVPKISVSWRDCGHASYVIRSHLQEIAAQLSTKPDLIELIDKHEKLRDWSKRDYVMLENLSLIEQLANDSDISGSIHKLQDWIEDNKNKIISFIDERRGIVEFQTAYLYARRNSIMHKGITDFSNMEFFVSELENLLKRIISVSLTFPSETTWDAMSEQFNRPFSMTSIRSNS